MDVFDRQRPARESPFAIGRDRRAEELWRPAASLGSVRGSRPAPWLPRPGVGGSTRIVRLALACLEEDDIRLRLQAPLRLLGRNRRGASSKALSRKTGVDPMPIPSRSAPLSPSCSRQKHDQRPTDPCHDCGTSPLSHGRRHQQRYLRRKALFLQPLQPLR